MLSTICSAKQKSLQMCAELRHCQRWVTNGEWQRVNECEYRLTGFCGILLTNKQRDRLTNDGEKLTLTGGIKIMRSEWSIRYAVLSVWYSTAWTAFQKAEHYTVHLCYMRTHLPCWRANICFNTTLHYNKSIQAIHVTFRDWRLPRC